MKKSLIIVLVVVLSIALLAACSSPGTGTGTDTSTSSSGSSGGGATTAASSDIVFGNALWSRSDVWNSHSSDAFEYAASQVGATPLIVECQYDMEMQVNAIQDFINQNVDGISFFQITPELSFDLGEMCAAAGIPMVVENAAPKDGTQMISWAGYDYGVLGYECGVFMSETWPGKTVLLVMGALGMGMIEDWEREFDRAVADMGNVITVAENGRLYTDWATEKAMNVTQDFIQSGRDFDALFAQNGQMYMGCMSALKDAGLHGNIVTMSEGGNPQELDWIRAGDLTQCLSILPNAQGLAVFQALWMYVHGDTPPPVYDLPYEWVTIDNVDDVYTWTDNEKLLAYLGGLKTY